MSVRLVVTSYAAPGKGTELAQLFKARCADTVKEPGCEQFEIFQSAVNPDKLVLVERWVDQQALDVHIKTLPGLAPIPKELRLSSELESYTYNRTR